MKKTKIFKLSAGIINLVAALFITILVTISVVKSFTDNLSDFYDTIFFIPPLFILIAVLLSIPLFVGVSVAAAGGLMVDRAIKTPENKPFAFSLYALICEAVCVLVTISTAMINFSAIIKGYAETYNIIIFICSVFVLLTSTIAVAFNAICLCEPKQKTDA